MMGIEPITRKEMFMAAAAGESVATPTPVTREEYFLSKIGGGGGGVTTLHINVTAVNMETMEATFTADKTPSEMQQASATGPVWCVISFPAGIFSEESVSIGLPPAWVGVLAFGLVIGKFHEGDGSNHIVAAVTRYGDNKWSVDLNALSI